MTLPDCLFRETQRISESLFVRCLLIVISVLWLLIVSLVVYQAFSCGRPVSAVGWTGIAAGAFALALVSWIILSMALTIEVREDGVYLRYPPFIRRFRRLILDGAAEVRAVEYRPLRYGGWGIRWVPRGIAYNVRGKRGVRIDFAGGRHVLLGTQRPEELENAVLLAVENHRAASASEGGREDETSGGAVETPEDNGPRS